MIQISCIKHSIDTKKLHLVNTYEVITNGVIEPSGLTLWDGVFYTVSDKSDVVYRLDFKDEKIELFPLILLKNDKGSKLDFEGITHDKEFFYLVSEKYFQILKISKNGQQQSWLPAADLLKLSGLEAGLFQTTNANLEGICVVEKGNFLLAAERQPRGFVEYDSNNNTSLGYQVNQAKFVYKTKRSPDFTGLSCDDGMYVLDRNAYIVAELVKTNNRYVEGIGYSYEHIVNQPHLSYEDMEYGHAEGLVVQGDRVYIILDNNRNPRSNSNNNNSLFFELTKKL